MRVSPLKADFSAGELSPLAQGDTQSPAYKSGVKKMLNFLPNLQKSVTRRPGTQLVYGYINTTKKLRILPFVFNNSQSYVLELGDLYMQFYTQEDIIETGGVAYFIVTPYAHTELFAIRYAQSGDSMYLVHPSHRPYVLRRFSNISWTLTAVDFTDGPYLDVNLTATTFSVNNVAAAAGVTLTASVATFAATDVGRHVRLNPLGNQWAWGIITGFTSTTVVTVTMILATGSVAATRTWRLGKWSTTTGWPGEVRFHQGRLWFTRAAADPLGVDGSVPQSYTDFTPTAVSGNVTDANAVGVDVLADDQDGVIWLRSNPLGLEAGTTSGEYVISAASTSSNAITPTDVQAVRQTAYGSDPNVAPVVVGRSTLFMQRASRKLREMYYYYFIGGFEAEDISLLSEHLTESGIKEMAVQREPTPIVWMARNDGTLVGVTYERKLQDVKVGWHQHALGGQSTLGGDPPVVESVTCIPTTTASPFRSNTQDELWLVVRRMVDGLVIRTIEYMYPTFKLGQFELPITAFYVDCGSQTSNAYYIVNALKTNPVQLELNVPVNNFSVGSRVTIDGVFGMTELNGNAYNIGLIQTGAITGITKANPAVVTSNVHPFVNGQQVYISGVVGMTQVNGFNFVVAGATANTFQLAGVNSTGFTTYTSGGTANGPFVLLSDRHGVAIDGTGFSAFATGPNGVPGVSATGILAPQGAVYGPQVQFKSTVTQQQTIQLLGDGSAQETVADASGNVPIDPPAGFITVGFPYDSDLELLPFDAGSQEGTAVGKSRRTYRLGIVMKESANLKVGFNGFDNMKTLENDQVEALPVGTPLFTGTVSYTPAGDNDSVLEETICLRMDTPLPCTVLSIAPMMDTQDRQ